MTRFSSDKQPQSHAEFIKKDKPEHGAVDNPPAIPFTAPFHYLNPVVVIWISFPCLQKHDLKS